MCEVVNGKVTTWPEGRRYLGLNEAAWDLRAAVAFLELCVEEHDPSVPRKHGDALWIAAITQYGKVFRRNDGREGLSRAALWQMVSPLLTDVDRRTHAYLMILCDRYVCHDDGVGGSAQLGIG